MEKIVLDTYAIAAFFYDEPGSKNVEKLIVEAKKNNAPILISAVNYGEMFYSAYKKDGKAAAIKARNLMDSISAVVIDADREMALLAGSIKAENRMSYADCFAAATAMAHKAAVVTGDKEFKEVEGKIRILWI